MPGEVLALVGESGSGKTTLIRAIQGLTHPTSGSVLFEGKGADARHLPDVQMVFQDPTGALNPRRTVAEIVAEGLRIEGFKGNEAEAVATALSRAGLRPPERFLRRFPHEISGGQRQRVVIAGAMVTEPRLLLADEPVASLDASIRGEILGLLRSLVDTTGLSVLVVTHDLGLAWNIADRVAVMYLGRIIEVGRPRSSSIVPKHPYTKALLSVVPETKEWSNRSSAGKSPTRNGFPQDADSIPGARCLQSGESDRLGIAERCRGVDPAISRRRSDPRRRVLGRKEGVRCQWSGVKSAPDL